MEMLSFDDFKSHLREMMIRRECLPQPEFFHDHEACAICEGEIPIPEPKENCSRFFSSFYSDPFPLQTRATFDLAPPRLSRRETQTDAEQG